MDKGRRNFLKNLGLAALGLGGGAGMLRAVESSREFEVKAAPGAKQWAMVIDVKKCRAEEVRRACAEACRRAHNIPVINDPKEEVKWIWSEKYEHAFPEQVHKYSAWKDESVLVLCNHCTTPACVRVCPTQATWKRKSDGLVMMDMHRCIGCRYCMAACPYGARSFNWRDPRPYIKDGINPNFPTRTKGVVEKCNFCVDRLRVGKQPACVEAAATVPGGAGALTFGNLSDPQSPVRKLLREQRSICRRVGAGTGPNVFYIV